MKRLFCVILSVFLLLTAAACGKSGGEATYLDAGYYDLFSMTRSTDTLTREDMDAMHWKVYLDLGEDGTGVLDLGGGEVIDLTWSDGSVTADGGAVPYTLAGGMLNLDLSDDDGPLVLVFQKSQPADAPAPAEEAAAPAALLETAEEPAPAPEPTAEPTPEPTPEPAPEPEATTEPDSEPEETEAPEEIALSELPVVLDSDDLRVEIVGAESFVDMDGRDAVRFYYDFTCAPDGEDTLAPWLALSFTSEQGGSELESTFAGFGDDVPEFANDTHSVEPGVTIRCVNEYALAGDGAVTFTVNSDLSGESASAVFDPAALPGRPSDTWSAAPIDDPQFFIDYPNAASTEGFDVEIVNAELTDSIIEGDPAVLRMFFQVTNNTSEPTEAFWLMNLEAYQDGISLSIGIPAEETETDAQYYNELPAGETVILSACWDLRSDSPVEVTVSDTFGMNGVIAAATLPIA